MSGKVIRSLALCGIVVLPPSALAEVVEEFLETPLAAAFGAPPTIADPILAPDGSRLLFMQQNPLGVSMLLSLNFADGAVDIVLERIEDGYDILWCRFANETRVLCDLRQGGRPDNRNMNYHRYVAVNADGTQLRDMPPAIGCRPYHDVRGQPMVDWVPENPERILFLCPPSSPTLLDINRGRRTEARGAGEFGGPRTRTLVLSRGTPQQWELEVVDSTPAGPGELGRRQRLYSNGHGLGNLYRGRENNIDLWFTRESVRGQWQQLLQIDPLAFESPFQPAGYGSDLDRVFNIAWDAETQAWSLYRQDLTGGENERVFAHGVLDVELVDTMGPHQRVVAAAFLEGRPRRAIVDPRIAEVYEYVSALFPELDVEIVDESWDRNLYLVRVRAPNRAGEFVLVDMEDESVQPIVPEYAHLADKELAETRYVQFEASTGGTVTGHLILPQGAEGPVPAVIMPRPRASHEELADPHYLAQFLAASGYAVFRVNNRVEEEYGRGWLPERAIAGWNQSADDINDAASFLVENGISAPGMICGAGKNYGAYVALMSAIRYPELFSCIVSIAGVTDPSEVPGGIVLIARRNADLLDAASPVRRATELDAPTLLFHGWGDADFGIEHAVRLADRLERADKDVALVEYEFANHEIRFRSYRIDMLTRMRGFLAEHIGPPLTAEENAHGVSRWRP